MDYHTCDVHFGQHANGLASFRLLLLLSFSLSKFVPTREPCARLPSISFAMPGIATDLVLDEAKPSVRC